MKIVRKKETNLFQSASTKIEEYLMDEPAVSGAVAHIGGRYPETGFAVNEISKEIVYVLEGSGHLVQPEKTTDLSAGDVLFVDKTEPFAWQGTFSIFLVTAPKFDPTQHKITEK